MVKATAAQGAYLWRAVFGLQLCPCPILYAKDGGNHQGWKGCSVLMQKCQEIFWEFLLSFLSSHLNLFHKICLTGDRMAGALQGPPQNWDERDIFLPAI